MNPQKKELKEMSYRIDTNCIHAGYTPVMEILA